MTRNDNNDDDEAKEKVDHDFPYFARIFQQFLNATLEHKIPVDGPILFVRWCVSSEASRPQAIACQSQMSGEIDRRRQVKKQPVYPLSALAEELVVVVVDDEDEGLRVVIVVVNGKGAVGAVYAPTNNLIVGAQSIRHGTDTPDANYSHSTSPRTNKFQSKKAKNFKKWYRMHYAPCIVPIIRL